MGVDRPLRMNSVSAFSLQILVFLTASFTVQTLNLEDSRLEKLDELIRLGGASSLGIPEIPTRSGMLDPGSTICQVIVEQDPIGKSLEVAWSEGDCPDSLDTLVYERWSEFQHGRWLLRFDRSLGILAGVLSRIEGPTSPRVYEWREFIPGIPGGYAAPEELLEIR